MRVISTIARGFIIVAVVALVTRSGAAQATTSSTSVTVSAGDASRTDDHAGGVLFNRPGVYLYVPEPDQGKLIKAAVNRAVARMLPIVRTIARHRLMATNPVADTLRILVGQDTIGTQLGREKPLTLPRNGELIVWEDGRGNTCRARTTVAADTLFQSCIVGTAASLARFILADDGRVVSMDMHITSPRLSEPVDYVVTYRRAE